MVQVELVISSRRFFMRENYFDVLVAGGGVSGVCAAISAARSGAKTALIQNRPVLIKLFP